MNIIEYADRDMAAIDVANVLAGDLESCLFNHDHASFAVPGGTTPGPMFDALCAADLDWSRVHVLPTDERWVEPDDERSNARLIRGRLLVGRAAAARFVPLHAVAGRPEDALSRISAAVEPELPISVLLLGMGEDMHTASLFPGARGLEAALASDAPPVTAQHPDTTPEARISLSGHVLDGALSKHLLIFGAAKREALERAAGLPPEEAPINAVLTETMIHWAE